MIAELQQQITDLEKTRLDMVDVDATAAVAAAEADAATAAAAKEAMNLRDSVGRYRLTVSKPMLKAPVVSALEATL